MAKELVHTSATLTLDPNQLFSMKGISETLFKITPSDPSLKVIGVDFTLIGLQCKTIGIIDPVKELQEAASRIYDYAMKAILNPIWTALYSLYNTLKRFGLAVIDLKLPVLGLRISDLFNPNLYDTVEKAIKDLYYKAKDKIIAILNTLGIPYPLFKNLNSPEEEIRYLVKHICASLWDQLMKKINLIKDLIQQGLRIWDLIVYKTVVWSEVWKESIKSVLKTVLNYLNNPPSIADIKKYLEAFAKKVLNKVEVTAKDILSVIKNFEIKPFGKPFDWTFPINPKINFPEVDFNQLLGDIKLWLNNFVMNLIQQFVRIIKRILSIFGITISLPKISIPISVCAYRFTP